MNQAIANEIILGLRRIDAFPAVTIAAVEQTIQSYIHYHRKGPWNPDLFVGIVLEFIFRVQQNHMNVKRTKLNNPQRLEVAEIILTRLSTIEYDNDRQILFNTFFPNAIVSVADGNIVHNILSFMTSLSVVSRNQRVLKTIGDWMMAVGVDCPAVLSISNDIATDLRTDENVEKYNHLPHTAFSFSSILLIAIAKIFNKNAPPKRLVSQVVYWIESSPAVCFIPPHSAVFDLFRWVVNSNEDQSRLHLSLLSAIASTKSGIKAQLQTIPQILMLISELRMKFETMNANNNMNNHKNVSGNTERLLQLIQVLIGAECLDRNEMHPIFEALEQVNFPSTRLYEIMKFNYVK